MVKRIFSLLISILILTAFFNIASAENLINAHITYNSDSDSYLVSGDIKSERGNIPLTLKMSLNGETVAVSQTVAERSDGGVLFSFPEIRLSDDIESGTVAIEISGLYLNEGFTFTYDFKGADYYLDILKEISSAIKGESPDDIGSLCIKYDEELDIDGEAYSSLGTQAKGLWENSIKNLQMSLPDNYTATEAKEKIKKELQNFREAYRTAVSIGEFSDADTNGEISEWLENYTKDYNFGKDNFETSYNEAKIWEYYSDIKNEETFLVRLSGNNVLSDLKQIENFVYESILLSQIEIKGFYVTQKIMTDFSELFPADWSRMNMLTSEKKGEIFASVAGKAYFTYKNAADALNLLLPSNAPVILPSYSGGGGSGSGGGSFSVDSSKKESETPSSVPSEESEKYVPFDDLGDVSWAEEAILYLNKKGVVSGKGNRKFDPQSAVTRGEFVKILVIATEQTVKDSYTYDFKDADLGDWYYPYLCAAMDSGLLYGDGTGALRPDDKVTREEIATMLYRAYRINEEMSLPELTFSDADEISDYALTAVKYFSNKGIINGIGNNLFAPKKNATRAEAAKLIYGAVYR